MSRHPLTPWGLVLVMVLGFWGIRARGPQGVRHPHAEAISRSLEAAEQRQDDRPLLLFIGDSRLHHWLPPADALEQAWGADAPRTARVTAAGLSLQTLAPMQARVLALAPSWVVIQLDALVPSGRDRGAAFSRLRRRLLAPRIAGPERTDLHREKLEGRWAQGEPGAPAAALAASEEFLRALGETTVRVLTLPRSPAELALADRDWLQAQRDQAGAMLTGPNQALIRAQAPADGDAAFHDHVHLSETGRAGSLPATLELLRAQVR